MMERRLRGGDNRFHFCFEPRPCNVKIESLTIPDGYKGLSACTLRNLSDVVLIAGPNGGGKSRVLDAVRENCSRNRAMSLGQLRANVESVRQELETAEESRKTAARFDAGSVPRWTEAVDRISAELKHLQASADIWPAIHPDPVQPPFLVDFSSSEVRFPDCRPQGNAMGHGNYSELGTRLDLGLAIQHGPEALYKLMANAVAATSSMTTLTAEQREAHQSKFNAFNNLAKEVLGSEFSMGDWEAGPVLFGQALDNGGALSAGQRYLLAMLYVLFFQAEASKDVVVIWDEPENHLHPDAVINLLERIRTACPGAQLWIATHSIHVLSHFQEQGIWFAQSGVIARGGKVAEKVLSSLLGDERRIGKLAEFLALPAQRAIRQFASECLVEPGVVDTLPGDAQTMQIFDVLKGRDDTLRILDFGAGKGRLLGELMAHPGVLEKVDYHAYDYCPSDGDQRAVREALQKAYGEHDSRYYVGSAESVLGASNGRFDVVVMCNVLHEVEPQLWESFFGPDGAVARCLNDSGSLLIVEDYVLAAGERAHNFGFLLLEANELSVLFNAGAGEIETYAHATERYRERLKAHVVPKAALLRLDRTSVLTSLQALRDRSYAQAREIHAAAASNSGEGHRLAVATHQHLNALLALDALDVKAVPQEAKQVGPEAVAEVAP